MKILVIGGGGREHALAWKAAQSPLVDKVYVAPGNAGTAREPGWRTCAIDVEDIDALLDFARDNDIGLTIVGPEAPLVIGRRRCLRGRRPEVLRTDQGGRAARGLEVRSPRTSSRATGSRPAAYRTFTEVEPALAYLRDKGAPIVVKADGLAAGKGVIVAMDAGGPPKRRCATCSPAMPSARPATAW